MGKIVLFTLTQWILKQIKLLFESGDILYSDISILHSQMSVTVCIFQCEKSIKNQRKCHTV